MAETNKNKILNLQPQALEAEEAVLGSMMIDEDAANKAISILGSSHYFYKDSHRKIFDAMGTSEKTVLDCELKNRKKFRGY